MLNMDQTLRSLLFLTLETDVAPFTIVAVLAPVVAIDTVNNKGLRCYRAGDRLQATLILKIYTRVTCVVAAIVSYEAAHIENNCTVTLGFRAKNIGLVSYPIR